MLDLFRIFSLKDVDNTAEGRLFFLSKWMNFQKKKKPGGHLRSQQIFAGFCIVNGQRPFGRCSGNSYSLEKRENWIDHEEI